MFEGNWGNKPERCLVEDAFRALVVEPVVRATRGPKGGTLPGRSAHPRSFVSLSGKPLLVNICSHTQGFDWVNEGKRPDSPKWGYVAKSVGNNLKMRVRTASAVRCRWAWPATLAPPAAQAWLWRQVPLAGMDFGPQRQLVIGLGFLMSYEHMGYALVACLEVRASAALHADTSTRA